MPNESMSSFLVWTLKLSLHYLVNSILICKRCCTLDPLKVLLATGMLWISLITSWLSDFTTLEPKFNVKKLLQYMEVVV